MCVLLFHYYRGCANTIWTAKKKKSKWTHNVTFSQISATLYWPAHKVTTQTSDVWCKTWTCRHPFPQARCADELSQVCSPVTEKEIYHVWNEYLQASTCFISTRSYLFFTLIHEFPGERSLCYGTHGYISWVQFQESFCKPDGRRSTFKEQAILHFASLLFLLSGCEFIKY